MAKRFKMKPAKARKMFSRTAERVHPKNNLSGSGASYVMRGGIRLT
jgi:hypothetical protein